MTASLVTALAAAGLLGVTHAVEPDHVAGISALSSRYADFRRSVLAGACFAVGHVVLVVIWVLVGYVVLGRSSYPAAFDALGSVGVAVLLGLLGVVMTLGGLRRLLHVRRHEQGADDHHPHLHGLWGGHAEREHEHDPRTLLKTGIVGALFTLSPPLTMIAFSSTLIPQFGPGVVALAVAAYAVAIVGTMGLLGLGVAVVFDVVDDADGRAHAALRVVAGLLLGGLAVSVLAGSGPILI